MPTAPRTNANVIARTQYDASGELFFKQVFAHSAIGLVFVGLDGRFTFANPAMSQITGYPLKELKRLTMHALMHPDDLPANAVLRHQMLDGVIPGYILEKRFIKKDGSIIWVKSSVSLITDENDKPLHIMGLIEDIDERHRAEEAVKASEASFRSMAEAMPQKIFTTDPNGRIDYISPQWAHYTGLNPDQMGFDEWSHIVHPDDRDANQAAWQHALETGKPLHFEHRLRRYDGTYRWHVSQAHPMHNEQGFITRWIGSATDIEELRQSRELKSRLDTLASQREELLAMNQAKDEFIMLASHQLRTPAAGVKQNVGLMLEGFAGDITDQQRTLLMSAYDCNERQIKIVDSLLRVARLDAGQVRLTKQPTDITTLVKRVIDEQRHILRRRHQTTRFTAPEQSVTATIDSELMHIVLENLLDNASKYSPEGRPIVVSLDQDSDRIALQVTDSGVGIRKKDTKNCSRNSRASVIRSPRQSVAPASACTGLNVSSSCMVAA